MNPRVDNDPFAVEGEMAALMRAADWSSTPLGPAESWPQSLRTVVRVLLTSRFAMWMGWGPDLTFFYNDAYGAMTLGAKHPWALGRPSREVWAEIWPDIGPRIDQRAANRRGDLGRQALLLFLERSGYPEETYHTFSYSPVTDDSGAVAGMLLRRHGGDRARASASGGWRCCATLPSRIAPAMTETRAVCGDRAMRWRRLAGPAVHAHLPLRRRTARARGWSAATGIAADHPVACRRSMCPRRSRPGGCPRAATSTPSRSSIWRAASRTCPTGPWHAAAARRRSSCPSRSRDRSAPAGIFVAGLNPFRPLDDAYRELRRPARRADRRRPGQRPRLRRRAAARRGAGRDRSRQDDLLLQRQPRVPHAADAACSARSTKRAAPATPCHAPCAISSTSRIATACGC